jgi:hypothetical protein
VEESERQRDVSDERLLRPRDRPPPEKAPFREEQGQEQEQEAPPILSRGNKHLQTIWGKQKIQKYNKYWKSKGRETRNTSRQSGVHRSRSALPFFLKCTRVTLLALLSLLTLVQNTVNPQPKRSAVSFLFFSLFCLLTTQHR